MAEYVDANFLELPDLVAGLISGWVRTQLERLEDLGVITNADDTVTLTAAGVSVPIGFVEAAGVEVLLRPDPATCDASAIVDLLGALEPYRGEVCDFGVGGWVGAIDLGLARTAATLRRWDDAEIAFSSALRIQEAWGAVPLVAATLTSHAAMLRRRSGTGDRARAARLSSEAAHLSRPAPTRNAPLGRLTARESDILRLLARGASNKEIARNLSLSVHTVERHVANLYQKIGVRNRAEATAYHLRSKDPR
jgi:DNA-binding CsgD family transcriptional regulator